MKVTRNREKQKRKGEESGCEKPGARQLAKRKYAKSGLAFADPIEGKKALARAEETT